jgi:hypothetical protein
MPATKLARADGLQPTKPNAAGVGDANIEKEWNQSTGVFAENPRNGPYATVVS